MSIERKLRRIIKLAEELTSKIEDLQNYFEQETSIISEDDNDLVEEFDNKFDVLIEAKECLDSCEINIGDNKDIWEDAYDYDSEDDIADY